MRQHSDFTGWSFLSCAERSAHVLSFAVRAAALGIVKEVANHANDIMKQGVRADSVPRFVLVLLELLLTRLVFLSQDNFQKLMHIQYSLNGHHEIVQPGRVSQLYTVFLSLNKVNHYKVEKVL